jgi:flagellar biosynthesis protein FlhG
MTVLTAPLFGPAPHRPRPTATRPGRLVGVASGKGGVGKTCLAIALAHALARRGRRVLLFDGDLGLANVDIQLGLLPGADLGAVAAGRVGLAEARQTHSEGGFDIIAGRSGSGALSTLSANALELLLEALRELARGYDFVLLDLGAGLDRAVRRMTAFADIPLVVVTDEPTSLTDAYAVLKLLHADAPDAAPRVVVNQASSQAAGEKTFATIARACQTFLGQAPVLAGVVRRDEKMRETIRRQALLTTRHPNCPAAADIATLAATLDAITPG